MLPTSQQEETKDLETSDQDETLPLQITSNPSPNCPQSLVARPKDHSKRNKIISRYCNSFYDIVTIFISIADVTTDIIVLISYYNANHMIFFWISLVILIIAQIGYLIVFFLSFDVEDFVEKLISKCCGCKCCDKLSNCIDKCLHTENKCAECTFIALLSSVAIIFGLIVFALLLPFGHLVSFLMYFAENESSRFSVWLKEKVGIQKRTNIPLEEHLSEMAQFTIEKINKHGGFMLEAFLEALPQSILQLIAMVYFKETNYIAVGSIILSMTSIMSKSLVISQGVEWKSYLFMWLCVCTDFFSIFFVVSWIFLSSEHMNGTFLGHFSVIGQVWLIKVAVAVVPPVVFCGIGYLCFGQWYIAVGIWLENARSKWWQRVLLVALFLTLGNAVLLASYCIGAVITCLVFEIMCFTIIAAFIWVFFTVDRWDYHEKKVSNLLSQLLEFVSDASYRNNDRIIRILCINYAYDTDSKLSQYIVQRKKEETLHRVSYKEIRNHCKDPESANIFSTGLKLYCKIWREAKREAWDNFDTNDFYQSSAELLASLALLMMIYISWPIYVLSRVVTILFPYFICVYLSVYHLWFKMDLFELSMLALYILLQFVIMIMAIFVFRTHLWLWHIVPTYSAYSMKWPKDMTPFFTKLYPFYDSIQWLPVTRTIVLNHFGPDIGPIIIGYLKD